MKALSNFDIDIYYKNNKLYGGCYARDTLPKNGPRGLFYIMNMDDEKGDGSHWVLIFDCLPDRTIYMDSFAVSPPEEALKFMQKTKKRLVVNDMQIQSMNSDSCGWMCLYVSDHLLKGYSLAQTILGGLLTTDNTNTSEKNLQGYFKQ